MNLIPEIEQPDCNSRVCAVVVTFNPNLPRLESLLKVLLPQVYSIIIVDNASSIDLNPWIAEHAFQGKVELIVNQSNLGIASAHNIGVEVVRGKGVGYVILFDQDSAPEHNLVRGLLQVHQSLEGKGFKVAVVGPHYTDDRNPERPAFCRLKGFTMVPVKCGVDDEVVVADFLISSGALIALSTLSIVGGMNESLFIDHVDHEWCFRARSLGYLSFGACSVQMNHALGEEPILFLGRKILHHSPLRHFFIFRNTVWMMRRSYVPLGWKWSMLKSIVARFLIYSLTVSPRLSYFRMMIYGVFRGIRGEMGPYSKVRAEL